MQEAVSFFFFFFLVSCLETEPEPSSRAETGEAAFLWRCLDF